MAPENDPRGLRRIVVRMQDRHGDLKPVGEWVTIEEGSIFDDLDDDANPDEVPW